jgi:hypothetical protein
MLADFGQDVWHIKRRMRCSQNDYITHATINPEHGVAQIRVNVDLIGSVFAV